jgi:hypothetical protein
MLSGAKHLAFSRWYEDEILRLRLRMTLRHSLDVEKSDGLKILNHLNSAMSEAKPFRGVVKWSKTVSEVG